MNDRKKLQNHIRQTTGEALRIVWEAESRGVILRLVGGHGIHVHCEEHQFCDRSHGDLDLVGLSGQYTGIVQLMEKLGYVENKTMTFNTAGSRLLFERPDSEEHIDVFLDQMNIEHNIDLRNRLQIEKLTLSVSDLLLAKLTISKLNEKDFRDIVTMIKDLDLGNMDSPATVNQSYIASLCAKEWGLYKDVLTSVDRTLAFLPHYSLPEDDDVSVRKKLETLRTAIFEAPKSGRWKLRALLGERIPWRREVESEDIKQANI
ncbi:MAG: hypothetical protein JSW05_06190 [Candidatus Thorarchaeota archaeon]|nr:MAG: hypothetical protein JSW05_06190 [Candidatus Thorarchaeota archaeon]